MHTGPPSGEYFRAFETRLPSTWRIRSGSAITRGISGGTSIRMGWLSPTPAKTSAVPCTSSATEIGSK
jgi:hypothetical protein